jgi:hypothetical protein
VIIAGVGGDARAAFVALGRRACAVWQPGQPALAALANDGSNAAARSRTITSEARLRSGSISSNGVKSHGLDDGKPKGRDARSCLVDGTVTLSMRFISVVSQHMLMRGPSTLSAVVIAVGVCSTVLPPCRAAYPAGAMWWRHCARRSSRASAEARSSTSGNSPWGHRSTAGAAPDGCRQSPSPRRCGHSAR